MWPAGKAHHCIALNGCKGKRNPGAFHPALSALPDWTPQGKVGTSPLVWGKKRYYGKFAFCMHKKSKKEGETNAWCQTTGYYLLNCILYEATSSTGGKIICNWGLNKDAHIHREEIWQRICVQPCAAGLIPWCTLKVQSCFSMNWYQWGGNLFLFLTYLKRSASSGKGALCRIYLFYLCSCFYFQSCLGKLQLLDKQVSQKKPISSAVCPSKALHLLTLNSHIDFE